MTINIGNQKKGTVVACRTYLGKMSVLHRQTWGKLLNSPAFWKELLTDKALVEMISYLGTIIC